MTPSPSSRPRFVARRRVYDEVADRFDPAPALRRGKTIDLPSNGGKAGLADDAAAVAAGARRHRRAGGGRRPFLRRDRRERGCGRSTASSRPRLPRRVHARRRASRSSTRCSTSSPIGSRSTRRPDRTSRSDRRRCSTATARRRSLPMRAARLTRQSVAAIATPQTAAAWQSLPSTYLICDEDRAVRRPCRRRWPLARAPCTASPRRTHHSSRAPTTSPRSCCRRWAADPLSPPARPERPLRSS